MHDARPPMKPEITVDQARAALQSIPANLPRDDWARIGMAIKSEFPDEQGFMLFDEWSATGEGYKSADVRSTWRSIKSTGGVGIGSLLHAVREEGFVLKRPERGVPAADASKLREKIERHRTEEAHRVQAQRKAAQRAERMWAAASEGPHSYLTRKGVQAYGVRVNSDGELLVPLRDEVGDLWSVQRILPTPPDDGPDKPLLKGGRKSGLWHMLGDPTAATAILIAEGYATAASVHEATGRPTAVAFDAGNLLKVAQTLRRFHPEAVLVLCGDDDQQTFANTGSNPGREKATAAAQAVTGISVFPDALPPGGKDFNDMHAHAGLGAIRALIEAAIEAHRAKQEPAKEDGPEARSVDVFHANREGVWFVGVEQDGKRRPPDWVCSPLDVAALTRDQDGAGWGYLLRFTDALGHQKQWAMPARMLSGDGSEYRAALLNLGLRISASPKAHNLLAQYIQSRAPGEFAQCTDRIGWHGSAFVYPRETVGDLEERIVFQTDSQMENTFKTKGSADEWKERIGKPCVGNSRLVFAVSCAFAGPLLRPGGVESGGFHLRGDSSSGKTTALKLAASVNGGPSYLQRWRTTDNALEAIAAQHCDSLLILDELAQVDPKTAGECAYMLANEQSKARATRTGLPRARLSWRLLFLSAGELGLADHMAEGMKRARTGQEVRMADIPADAGAGMGAFENLHGYEGGAAFARQLTQAATSCFGSPGRDFVDWACAHADSLKTQVRESAALLASQIIPSDASGQVERVGVRFALVGVAGELATQAGLTGRPDGEAESAAKACFNAWLVSRGGIGNGEVTAILRAVRRFLEAHGEGRFTWWHRAADDHNAKTLNRAGFRRLLNAHGEPIRSNSQHAVEYGDRMPTNLGEEASCEFFVLPEVFRNEVCAGFDYKAVCRVLIDCGVLAAPRQGELTVKVRLPGMGNARCYQIKPGIFSADV